MMCVALDLFAAVASGASSPPPAPSPWAPPLVNGNVGDAKCNVEEVGRCGAPCTLNRQNPRYKRLKLCA
jgi:hypothetical protein